MASVAPPSPYQDRRLRERRRISDAFLLQGADGVRVSWGGIWGGVLCAVGAMLLLTALGVAIGISAADPGETDASTLGAGAAIWSGVSLLLSLFLGGLVSTRIGAIFDRTTGFFEGALVWVVSILLMGFLASTGIAMVAGGAFTLLGGATQVVGQAIQGQPGVDVSGGVDQVAQRLRDPETARQLASATGLSQQEVQSSLATTAQRVESQRDNPGQAAAEAKQGLAQLMERAKSSGALERKAEEVKPKATMTAWITLGALLLSLIAAVLGAAAGRREVRATSAAAAPRRT
ncbi:MAG TPA: hypothetical protein VHN19_15915 [Burkholderiales bacterium]|jgi:hypothetical protein|nr:hypothetical protein [Burkholderiales bacterium]